MGKETEENEIQQRNLQEALQRNLRSKRRRGLGLGSFKPSSQAAGELGHQFEFAG
jgi:hypothetical protein